jgi:hypothetical protein
MYCQNLGTMSNKPHRCSWTPPSHCSCTNCMHYTAKECGCHKEQPLCGEEQPQNAVDKKTWMLEKYEQSQTSNLEVDKQRNVSKEKREPTVADLIKIIKLQNEQLQLLQEKVDKFCQGNNMKVNPPIQNYISEHVTFQSTANDQHKISIGVMTSFEMVRTSTVINKEIVTQSNDNTQIHCNRSQLSIKEVVSKTQPVHLNFLDGIMPTGKMAVHTDCTESDDQTEIQIENNNDDKMLNELSLYDVQVDNATTPLLSPEQSLYLDVRDYSE